MELPKETLEKLNQLESEYLEKGKKLILEEVKKINPYKIGDIIEDHYQIGKIKKIVIEPSVRYKGYNIYYRCEKLTKKLKPYKSGEETIIYGSNISKKLN